MIVVMVFASIGIEGVGCGLAMARISLTQTNRFARDRNAIAYFSFSDLTLCKKNCSR
jgi:hypothetical protein